ncbi:unnamed protein product [Oppiella nova]|uniref:TNase-like domain-containing protein n=1 Tax=Oppiella nova TaxID=334625 RepID=A0A7R9MCW8_9ACAR|nr:unnamed protein product [Oppiella nova]CAG2173795.1 unnamed protein product [Oppiella nova]
MSNPLSATNSSPVMQRAIVKLVLSGDSLIIRPRGQPKGGPPSEKQINLAHLIAPKVGRKLADGSTTSDESHGWESREFLRTKLMGKEIQFRTEYTIAMGNTTRELGFLFLGDENINDTVVSEGMAEVVRRQQDEDNAEVLRLIGLEESAKAAQKGKWDNVWTKRKVLYDVEEPQELVNETFPGIVEHVRDGSTHTSVSSEPQDYRKDSFGRICDDLCEVLLAYLPLKERFRFECVSTQWQRCVYTTQTELTYDDKIDGKCIEWVLKKCQNMTKIGQLYGFINNSMIQLIVKHCNHLNAIVIDVYYLSVDTITQFFTKFATSLRSIKLYNYSQYHTRREFIDQNLKICHNLRQLMIIGNSLSVVLTDPTNDVLFRRLNTFWFQYMNEDMNGFELFVKRYGNQMKSIDATIYANSNEAITILMTGLSRMAQLKRLKLTLYIHPEFALRSESLKGCQSLIHFTLLSYINNPECGEHFTLDIDKHLPHIQYIEFWGTHITDNMFNSLSKLPNVTTISCDFCDQMFTHEAINYLVTNCHKLRTIYINNRHFI